MLFMTRMRKSVICLYTEISLRVKWEVGTICIFDIFIIWGKPQNLYATGNFSDNCLVKFNLREKYSLSAYQPPYIPPLGA